MVCVMMSKQYDIGLIRILKKWTYFTFKRFHIPWIKINRFSFSLNLKCCMSQPLYLNIRTVFPFCSIFHSP